MIEYTEDVMTLDEGALTGFFVGWPSAPSPAQHLAVLRGSHRAVLAVDTGAARVVGFVNMISDGVLTAFIPWLEVLPDWQGRGIGTELMRRILAHCDDLYSVDLSCDRRLLPYYARLGMREVSAAAVRHPAVLHGDVPGA
ncbi:acetyltransferase (GNAT) family protein [Stackebrandtia albiflava]|uniref:Acetyltransferase (GNAT) family protein n=1 Tax=Stackebrandtia albiflava TaxID=406432 RepID=A0A562VCE7_9ACTN|nr:GNAT family N-acetyltransferase [Stackebrandtia albiflava]TWJ15546.1 acetyltransferase (GNAT) family protein [Stackebrandtia albiflava]